MSEKETECEKTGPPAGNRPVLSVVIPTYNERDNVVPLLQNLHRALSAHEYEVVVVDDNSQDGTIDLLNTLSRDYPIKLIVRKDKKGLATAVVDGFTQSSGRYISVMDADLQHPPELLNSLLEQVKSGADVAVASRYVEGGGCEGWGLMRRVMSKGAIVLAHIFLPQTRRTRDPMSGFFMFNRDVIAGIELKPQGYKILMELLVVGNYSKITDVPYIFRCRKYGVSKLSFKQQADFLKHIFSLMRRSGELLRFIKFCIVGLSGVLVNLGAYWLLTRLLYMNQFAALAISFEASVVSNFLLNNFFTFADRRVSRFLPFLTQLVKFNLVSLGGLGIQEGALWLLHTVLGMDDIIAVAIGIVLATIWNYTLNLWWTWK